MDGFLICPTHGDVLWDQDTSGIKAASRIRPAHPALDPDFRVKSGDVVECPLCGKGLRSELRESVAVAA